MEKILVTLVLVIINVGLYISFALSDRLNIPRKALLIFYLFFLIVAIVSWVYKGLHPDLIMSSIYLLIAHLLVYMFFKSLVPLVFAHNNLYQGMLMNFFNYFLMVVATLAVTIWQVLFLYDVS